MALLVVVGLSAGCGGQEQAAPVTVTDTEATVVDFPMTKTFVSPTNGFSFKYLGGVTPARELWDPAKRVDRTNDDLFDVVETGQLAFFKAASTEIPEGVSIDEWVDEYVSPGACSAPRSQQAEITIDGQSGRISECPKTTATVNEIEATVVAGGRLYLFTLLSDRDRDDARAVFDAWAATIDLHPETAAVP